MPGKGMSLAVQCTSTTGGEGLSPGWRTKTPHAEWPKTDKQKGWVQEKNIKLGIMRCGFDYQLRDSVQDTNLSESPLPRQENGVNDKETAKGSKGLNKASQSRLS